MNTAFTQLTRHLPFGRLAQKSATQQRATASVLHIEEHGTPGMNDKGWLFEQNGYTAQLCCTPESLEIAYRLRYKAYRHNHAIPMSPDGLAKDIFDEQHNTRTHLIWYEGKPVASVRSSIWSSRYGYLPTESTTVFRKEVKRYLGMKDNFIESAHFVTAPELAGRESYNAQIMLYRVQDLSSRFDNCEMIITAVQERHVSFYKRVLGFRQISLSKTLDWIDYDLVLMRAPMEESRELAARRGMPVCTEADCARYTEICNTLLFSVPKD